MKKFLSSFLRFSFVIAIIIAISYFEYSREIDYSKPPEELALEGNYKRNFIDFNDYHFKKEGREKIEFRLIPAKYLKDYDPNSVIAEMEQNHYRPATLRELLLYKTFYKSPRVNVIALGSSHFREDGKSYAPFINHHLSDDNKHHYSLMEIALTKNKNVYHCKNKKIAFLAVRK